MLSEKIESERLFLKPLSFNELLSINSNELSKIEISIEEDALLDEAKIAISKKIPKMQNVNEQLHEWYTYWLIINKNNCKGIGVIGFKGTPDENGFSEVGYSISPSYRKKGFMTEALSTLMNWASESSNCKGITATKVLKNNIGSNNVLNNCNFVMESSSEEHNNYIYIF